MRMSVPDLVRLNDRAKKRNFIRVYIKQKAHTAGKSAILEAGCGRHWPIALHEVQCTLTGIDINNDALEMRKTQQNDLHETILSDLRFVDIKENTYDVIYSSFVLEHIEGAGLALKNFLKWLKAGRLLILLFPDRDSVYGFVTRMTPFQFHIFYYKFIRRKRTVGRSGFGPFPTFYDNVISRKAIYRVL